MPNYRLTLSYDGSRYQGWQKQGNTSHTIQHKLEETLARILGEAVEVQGSGRTDAGVHARQQVASFRSSGTLNCDEVLAALRQYLPADIGAIALEEAPERFHARLSCREKTYVYRIWNSPLPCVFERRYVWHIPEPLDEDAMRRAAGMLVGTHDFAAFHTGKGKKSTVRTLRALSLERVGEELRLSFTGDGFLYNMVRILTGTLVEVGRGERAAQDMAEVLASGERRRAGATAPAQGLILWELRY